MRTIQEIQKEYDIACAKLGHIKYQRKSLKLEADKLLSELTDLNKEALELSKTSEGAKNE